MWSRWYKDWGFLVNCAAALAVGVCLSVLCSCATPLATANALSASATEIRAAAIPAANAECTAAITQCKASGIHTPTDCPPYVTCNTRRDAVYAAERTVHRGLAKVRWLLPRQELSKGTILARIVAKSQDALADLASIAKQAGWIK